MLEYFKKSRSILGMNSRNLKYIRPCNLKKSKRLADDKILSKKILKKGGIPVPDLIAKISSTDSLEKFNWSALPSSFVLKPNRGFGGEGIVIVYGRKKERLASNNADSETKQEQQDVWIKADGSTVTVSDLKNHIRNILDGSFSLSNIPDEAFFEERLQILKLFKPYAYKGVPDIRVIVYNKVPVMAMLRLPTKDSDGKANLQQGAIGVGIDLASGITTTAVMGKSRIIEYVPGTRLLLSGIKIPYWNDILKLAVKAQEVVGLGYLGADVAIDKEKGPVFLELNARPGLSIQIANLDGLKGRLERLQGLKVKSVERGVRMGTDLFGGEVEEELEDISGKKVIGTVEKVKLIGKEGQEIEVEAKIDTGAYSSSIGKLLAEKLGFSDLLNFFENIDLPKNFNREEAKKTEDELKKEYIGKHPDLSDIVVVYSSHGNSIRPKVRLNFILDNVSIIDQVNIAEREELEKEIIIGRKNLGRFLVDVNKQ